MRFQNATGSFITAERAKEIALNNAQLSASSVTFVKTNLEWENGVQVYEVEFWSGNIEYDYEINAYTGEIYSFDRDIENFSIPNTYYNTTQNNNSANSTFRLLCTEKGTYIFRCMCLLLLS